MNPTLVTQRANQFATATAGFKSTTLLLSRDADGMHGHLITVGTGGDSRVAATNLAHAVGARADEDELPEGLLDGNVVGQMVYESGSSVAREVQVGADPTETARLLANTLPHDCWIAIVLRRPTRAERNRNLAWLSNRFSTAVPTHHSVSKDAVVVSIYAGGPDATTVRAILDSTRSAMPGFDVATKAKVATRGSTLVAPMLTALAAVGVGVAAWKVPLLASLLVPAFGLAGVAVLFGLLRFAGIVPSWWRSTQSMAVTGHFPTPSKRMFPPKKPVKGGEKNGKTIEASDGSYPLTSTSFMAGPQVVIGVVAPQAGAVSGESTTKSREVPPAMLKRIGPLVGDSDAGPAYISAFDAFGGVAIVGKAGSGKSVLTRSLFGWACLDRLQPTGLEGFPGQQHALVAFESKGDGVDEYQSWADAVGDVMVVVDLADPASFGIDIFAVPGTVFDKANFFGNALKYAFGENAVGDRSFETLLSLLPAALMVTPKIAGLVPDLPTDASPLFYTHTLLGGRGDGTAMALASELAAESVRPGADPMLREVVIGMGAIFGPKVTPAQRSRLQEAPRNKLRQLLELEHWWTPQRRKVTWEQVLNGHRIVVINTGTSRAGAMVEDELNAQMSAILLFSLRHAIQRQCSGWQAQGRHVSIFADELSLLAGSSEQVVAWFKDQGRSFGVRAVFATQRPAQLSAQVRQAFMNFSTLVSFTQEDQATAREIAEGVSGSDGEWSAEDVLNLNPYSAIVRAHVQMKRQPAFTIQTRYFEGDRHGFAVMQGYEQSAAPAPVAAPAYTPPSVAPAPIVVDDPGDDEPMPDLLNW